MLRFGKHYVCISGNWNRYKSATIQVMLFTLEEYDIDRHDGENGKLNLLLFY